MSKTTKNTDTNDQHEQQRECIFTDLIVNSDGQEIAENELSDSVKHEVERAIGDHGTPVEVTLTAEITPRPRGDE